MKNCYRSRTLALLAGISRLMQTRIDRGWQPEQAVANDKANRLMSCENGKPCKL